jgi:hypothetical protein
MVEQQFRKHVRRIADRIQAVRRLIHAAPNFRSGSLRKTRFADVSRLQSDLELLREAHLPE